VSIDSLVNVANSAFKGSDLSFSGWYDFPESQTRVLHYTLLNTHIQIHRAFETAYSGTNTQLRDTINNLVEKQPQTWHTVRQGWF
jgi:hypothetical protein